MTSISTSIPEGNTTKVFDDIYFRKEEHFQRLQFIGHIVIGVWFIAKGLWWSMNVLMRYLNSHTNKTTFRSQPWFSISANPKLPLEIVLTITYAIYVIYTSLEIGLHPNLALLRGRYYQHVILFLFILLHQICNLMQLYKMNATPNLNYYTLCAAFFFQGFTFQNHTHGRTGMDHFCHHVLGWCYIALAFITALECAYKSAPIYPLLRGCILTITGTWYIQIVFLLYPLPSMYHWDQDNHENLMFTFVLFACHCFLNILFLLLVNVVADSLCFKKKISYRETL